MAARAIDDVEHVAEDGFRRTALLGAVPAVIEVTWLPPAASMHVQVQTLEPCEPADVATRVTQLLDLDRDLAAIGSHFAQDPFLSTAMLAHPALRVPGGWDAFELAVRAILGQQVTVQAARRLASDLVSICGTPLPADLTGRGWAGCSRLQARWRRPISARCGCRGPVAGR